MTIGTKLAELSRKRIYAIPGLKSPAGVRPVGPGNYFSHFSRFMTQCDHMKPKWGLESQYLKEKVEMGGCHLKVTPLLNVKKCKKTFLETIKVVPPISTFSFKYRLSSPHFGFIWSHWVINLEKYEK